MAKVQYCEEKKITKRCCDRLYLSKKKYIRKLDHVESIKLQNRNITGSAKAKCSYQLARVVPPRSL